METKAVFNLSYEFMPGSCWRRSHDNPAIGFAEGLQFIAGIADKEAIAAAAPSVNLGLFGPTSFYGPRTVGQFSRVIDELTIDPRSRRAVVMIAHHDDVSSTLPCTLSMDFQISSDDNTLRCTITVRSSDAVWGLPYDQIQYGMVIMAVANCLGIPVGPAIINIANAHIYNDHTGSNSWTPNMFSIPVFQTWQKYADWANATVVFHPTRNELEKLFWLSDEKIVVGRNE
jgi:hypothetical protein